MLLKVLFLVLLLYLALKAVANLFRAIWNDPKAPERIHHSAGPRAAAPRFESPPARAASRQYHVEVEDAQWVDVTEQKDRRP